MTFAIPSLRDLVQRARSAYRANLPGTDAWLWPNNVNPSAKVMGGLTHEVFGFADYIQRQKFAVTAPDIESLRLHGEEFGIPQKPAAAATGTVFLTATTAVTVGAGAVFTRSDGVAYAALVAASIPAAGTLDVRVTAATTGKATTAEAGTPLAITSGVTGSALAEVGGEGIRGGADLEDIESYRARILFRKRNPPHGGAPADYVSWALEVPGVTRVYVERRHAGPGTVRVYPLMDEAYADGIPLAGDIAAIQAHIDGLAPAGAIVTVAAAEAQRIDLAISGLAPDTSATREAAIAELRDTVFRHGRVAGADVAVAALPFLATPFVFSRSWLWQAVANAAGEERHALDDPGADITIAAGSLPVLGTVVFA